MKLKIRKKQRHPKSLFLGIADVDRYSYHCNPFSRKQQCLVENNNERKKEETFYMEEIPSLVRTCTVSIHVG
ncbi:MAG: hypothetical protein ACOCO5_05635, partial [Segatella copri]